jgi:hypothetical protein
MTPNAGDVFLLVRDAQAQKVEATRLVEAAAPAAFAWRPAPGKWSIGEHLAHVPKTTRPYVAALDAGLRRARRRGLLGSPPYRRGRIGEWFVASMEPPPRRRMPTLRRLVPAPPESAAAALADFLASQDELVASLASADGIDLGRGRMRSPFLPLLTLSLEQGYRAVLAHTRRHLWHMQRILDQPDRPG